MTRVRNDKVRRWLVALDPIFESGRRATSAEVWDVEDRLTAIAILGDVTIDLSKVKSLPEEITIDAYAILRDVDLVVGADTSVELSGSVFRGSLRNETPVVPAERRGHAVRIHGHSVVGDVTVRVGP